ncbi:MAG TPA: CAP domain-containing protein [Thermoanaerobaculia bacterium]
MAKPRTFLAMLLTLALGAPPLSAQSTLENLARDLNRALGPGHVEVTGRPVRRASAAEFRGATVETPAIRALVDDMNRERAAYGLAPLHLNQQLTLAAGDRINDMFAKHYFNHISPDGIDPFTWADKRGYDYRLIGENLAVGYPTASGVVDGWMHSPAHRANILKKGFDEIGVAIAPGSPARPYAGPTVVALYGSRNS